MKFIRLSTFGFAFILYFKLILSEDYQGLYLGKFNTYFHQVSGNVYVVDDHTFLIKSFFYDGLGKDTYFWAGTSIRPSNIGFLVGNENGRTNVLKRYIHKDILIRLPEDRRVKQLKWLAIWDINSNQNFGDIYIPDGFEPPSSERISQFSRLSNGVKSDPVIILNSKLIKISSLSFDGLDKNAYFYVGNGPQPNSNGEKIPNEMGYYDNLGKYENEDIVLELPGEKTIFDIDWLAIWNNKLEINLGSVLIPDSPNIPPLINHFIKYDSFFPNCEQLHRRLQLSWEVFGPQITFEVAGQVDQDDYIAIGLTNSNSSKSMIGSDVALTYINGYLGHVIDFNLTDKFPCKNVLGNYYGVCPDIKLNGVDNFQLNQFKRMDGLNIISFRRNLKNDDPSDIEIKRNEISNIIWAIGKLNKQKKPRLHYIYPKKATKIDLFRNNTKNCYPFTETVFSANKVVNSFNIENPSKLSERNNKQDLMTYRKNWGPLRILNQTSTTFYARLGVSGGPEKGYSSMTGNTQHSPGLVWYINGLMSPILYVQRGVTYTFRVEGGSDPLNTKYYNPLYLTTDPYGGYAQLDENTRKTVGIISGITFDKKNRPTPTAFGRYCVWEYSDNFDSRKSDNFHTFVQFRNHLNYTCEKSYNNLGSSSRDQAGLLVWTPDSSTPDIVYYQSYTEQNMGWKIIVLDDFNGAAQLLVSTGSSNTNNSLNSMFSINNILWFTLILNFLFIIFFYNF